MRITHFVSTNRYSLITILFALAVGGLIGAWYFGFGVDLTRFFAAEVGVMTVECSPSGNAITWSYDSRANSNSIQRGNNGVKNLPNCADYWCWLPSNNYPHQVPSPGGNATFTDTQLQSGTCYAYRIKYRPELPSNTEYCPTGCNVVSTPTPAPTPTPTPTLSVCPQLTPPVCPDGRDPVAQYGADECIVGWTCPTPTPEPTCVPVPSCYYEEPQCVLDLAPGAVLCPTPTPAPTTSAPPTPAPTGTPTGELVCFPTSQEVGVDETAEIEARGGTETYTWSAPGADEQQSSSGDVYRVSYPGSGGYTVTVNDGADITQCTVSVRSEEPIPSVTPRRTPVPEEPDIQVEKTVRNITRGTSESEQTPAFAGETVEFIIRITSVGDETARNVSISDELPAGLVFVAGSSTIDGQTVVVSAPTFSLGDMVSGQTSIVRFRATVSQGGGIDATNIARVFVSNTSEQFSDTATVTLVDRGSSTPLPVAQVPTGPGEASVIALIVSAIMTLMYVGYTSTDTFRRREAGGIARTGRKHPTFHG